MPMKEGYKSAVREQAMKDAQSAPELKDGNSQKSGKDLKKAAMMIKLKKAMGK